MIRIVWNIEGVGVQGVVREASELLDLYRLRLSFTARRRDIVVFSRPLTACRTEAKARSPPLGHLTYRPLPLHLSAFICPPCRGWTKHGLFAFRA